MGEKQRWFNDEWQKNYHNFAMWVEAANDIGWELTYDRAKNWLASGYLPNSLVPENYEVIAKTLHMSIFEVLRKEGFDIPMVIKGLKIPSSLVGYVERLCAIDEKLLQQIAPTLDQQLDALMALLEQLDN